MILEYYYFWLKILSGFFGSIVAGVIAVLVWEYYKAQKEIRRFNSIFKKILTIDGGDIFVSRYRDHLDAIAFEIKLELNSSERSIHFKGKRINEEGSPEEYTVYFIVDLKNKTGEGVYNYKQSSYEAEKISKPPDTATTVTLQRQPFGFSKMIYDEVLNRFYVMDHYAQHVPGLDGLKPLKNQEIESYIWMHKDSQVGISQQTSVPTVSVSNVVDGFANSDENTSIKSDWTKLQRLVFWREKS